MKTGELLFIAEQDGALEPQRVLLVPQPSRTHIPISVDITAGSAAVELLGRNTDENEWVVLETIEATDAPLIQWMPQMAARLASADAASVRVSLPVVAEELIDG